MDFVDESFVEERPKQTCASFQQYVCQFALAEFFGELLKLATMVIACGYKDFCPESASCFK